MNRYIIFLLVIITLAPAGFAQNVVKQVVRFGSTVTNLLKPDGFHPYESGFQLENGVYVCDNGSDNNAKRGVAYSVTLNQTKPEPIIAEAWSKAENVPGSPSGEYAIYIDLTYQDGTPLWGQIAPFAVGTHDWQKKTLTILPPKPVKSLTMYTLFRNKSGKVAFRDMKLAVLQTPENTVLFDGVPVVQIGTMGGTGLQIRDVVANSDFVKLRDQEETFGVIPTVKYQEIQIGKYQQNLIAQVTLTNSDDKDRCLTLVYTVRGFRIDDAVALYEPQRSGSVFGQKVEPNTEYALTTSMPNVGSGRLSPYPFAAAIGGLRSVAQPRGYGVGIDLKTPGFFRTGYNSGTEELFVAVDVALTKESPTATINFVQFEFDPKYGFRGALDAYYKMFPDYFASRTPEQGIWMPFSPISKVPNHEDFGFKFKEGNDETAWDDAHNILTFRYTEPGTWWMAIPPDLPQNNDSAIAEAKKLAEAKNPHALALFKSGMHDTDGKFVCQILDTPWCKGAVWSFNDMPEIEGGGFATKWSPKIFADNYERKDKGILDGEYVDSAEAYVTAMLDFRRENFAAVRTPLVFSQDDHQPAIFKGLMLFEYVRKIAEDMHRNDKLMFANSTPDRLCWLAPWFDVMGTETDWNHGGRWSPMSDVDMLYRRALCGRKPYCFLMNTDFTKWTYDMSERFMKRCLAYGMFPGYFSADASTKTYFSQPELYERDRPLFKKYVPLCKLVAESGWQPITLVTSGESKVYIERFGSDGKQIYFTVFNDSQDTKTAALRFEKGYATFKNLVSGKTETATGGTLSLTLLPEEVAVLAPVD